jgi:predicted NAD-dependent protein-ADP-ribosyltransferase YbiA (DUF1768 family)
MISMMHDEFPMEYICEASEAGKPSFEFPTIDHDTARSVCDASGWEFIRCYKKGGDSDRKPAPGKNEKPLSKAQIKALQTEGSRAWRHETKLGLTSLDYNTWRHQEVWKCVRREGLSECHNGQYTKLSNHFRLIRGANTKAEPQKWSKEKDDTDERRMHIIRQLATTLAHHARRVEKPQTQEESQWAAHANIKGGVITEAYLMKMAQGKNPAESLTDTGDLIKLPASRLEQLLWTLNNRIAAREGRGDPGKRNKKQR